MRRLIAMAGAMAMTVALAVPASAVAPGADGQRDSYVVIMAADPLVRTEGVDNLDTPKAKGKGAELKASHDKALRGAGLSSSEKLNEYTVALNGFSALLTPDEVASVEKQVGVAFVLKDQLRQPTTDSSPDFLGLTADAGPWETGITGEGVVVGVIDTGIWPEHPSFADDGSYSPLAGYAGLPCEFGNTTANPNDAPFTCNDKLLGARQMLATYRALIGADPDEFDSARDDNGHGSHTASTAAGNGGVAASMYGQPRGTISGIAPRARVIAYKGLGNGGGFTSDLAAAIDQAVADGVDVINYSIGGGAGAVGADELAFLFAADAGVFVANSAGNSGPGASTLGDPGTKPWVTTVGASTQSRFLQGTVILGNGAQYTGASITEGAGPAPLVDGVALGNALCNPAVPFSASVAGKIVVCQRGSVGRAAKSLAVFNAGGVGMIMHENSDAGNLFSDSHWVPSVHVDQTPGLAIKAYLAANPGTATAQIVAPQIGTWPYAPSMTDFSSRGPNPVAPDIIKPDVTAPGIQILAGNSPFPDPGTTPPGELFQAIAGTSMSSPHVAGLFALLKQANPDWSAAMAKSALMTTAHQGVLDNNRTSHADPFDMGAGHVNPGSAVKKGSSFQPGLAYDAGFNEYLGFMCDEFPEVFSNPAATCAILEGAGIATKAYNLNYPSIGVGSLAGSQTVTRTVTSVARDSGRRTYRVSVEAPAGYDVSVSPSTFSLRKGESATYQVTITNASAPIGAWRFGSLTWLDTSGTYSAYSPIAVRASEFSAPAAITGSGVSGSASFDVKFGYTGAYAAAAHGLVPATVTSDNVLQDVDQTFNPSDVGTGGANLHQFNLSGIAFLRIAIPPEATEANADLDVFVYNPSNQLAASSTAGGTDEVINITLPADGTWSVYVHGWAAPGGDSDYDMYSWAISATPGGNLAIDSAPASATIGATETIDLSWTGATAGEWHLGAVSHTGPSGLMGLTLVEVDNR
jgi:subtilisin family serine protease